MGAFDYISSFCSYTYSNAKTKRKPLQVCSSLIIFTSRLFGYLCKKILYSIIYVHIYSNQFGLTPKLYASTFRVCIKFMRYVLEHDHARVHERYVFFFCHQNYINTSEMRLHTRKPAMNTFLLY